MILPAFMLSRIYQIEVLTNILIYSSLVFIYYLIKNSLQHEKASKRGETIENDLNDETLMTEND